MSCHDDDGEDDDDDDDDDDDENYDEKLTCAGLLDVFDVLFQLHQALLVLGQRLQKKFYHQLTAE